MKTNKLALIAGAALSLGTLSAMAQSNEDRAYTNELMADSLTRSNAQGTPGGGFKITDGANSLKFDAMFKFRYTADFRKDGTGTQPAGTVTKDDKFTTGFEEGTKVWMSGTVADPNLSYYLQFDYARSGGAATLDDAFGKYKWDNGTFFKFGQYKLPFLREELVSDQYQLSADRSNVWNVFTLGRSQGIEFGYESDAWRMVVDFNDGARAKNTAFNSPAAGTGGEADYAFTARAEFLLNGQWSRFMDFTSFRGDGAATMIGAAVHYQHSGETGDGSDSTVVNTEDAFLAYTVDASFEFDGANLYAAFVGANNKALFGKGNHASNNTFGAVVQGGFFLNDNWELFGRYDGIFADKSASFTTNNANLDPKSFNFLTLGVNYYLVPKSHAMKVTGDVLIGLNKTYDLRSKDPLASGNGTVPPGFPSGGVLPNTQVGTLGDIGTGETAIQIQFQVLF